MPNSGIPPHVKTLILDHIDSVGQLDVLLLLQRDPKKKWRAASVASELRTDPTWAMDQLEILHARGLLQTIPGPEPAYFYHPSTPALEDAIRGLARAYAERRVSIINIIISKPDDRIQVFADAFRLRKDK